MPGRREHQKTGGPVGALAALGFAAEQPPALALVEIIGGWYAGERCASLPDAIEPATSSHHRNVAHGMVPTAYASTLAFQNVGNLQSSLRTSARQCFQTAQASQDGLQQLVCSVVGVLLHFAAGAAPAVPASYAAHVMLDAATPRGVPLLTRGL